MAASKNFSSEQRSMAEEAIRKERNVLDYNTVSFALYQLEQRLDLQKINAGLRWNKEQQSHYVESLLLGIPIFDVVANQEECAEGYSLNIIDGTQRVYTAINFAMNNLILCDLNRLTKLNGFNFENLMMSRQKKFKKISVRIIMVDKDFDMSIWKNR